MKEKILTQFPNAIAKEIITGKGTFWEIYSHPENLISSDYGFILGYGKSEEEAWTSAVKRFESFKSPPSYGGIVQEWHVEGRLFGA